MKTENLTFKVFTIAFLLLMLGFNKVNAQAASSCDHCVENNLECPVKVIITFYCNGVACTNNGAVVIAGNTTQCFQNPCNGCTTCDMEVQLLEIDPFGCSYPVPLPNKVSMSNPGPISIPTSACPGCFAPGSSPSMKFTGGLFWIGN